MFDQQVVFQHADLGDQAGVVVALAFAHHHRAVHGFTTRQEFSLADHVPLLAFLFPAFGAASALRLQPSGAFDPHGPLRHILIFGLFGLGTAPATLAAPPAPLAFRRRAVPILAGIVRVPAVLLVLVAYRRLDLQVLLHRFRCQEHRGGEGVHLRDWLFSRFWNLWYQYGQRLGVDSFILVQEFGQFPIHFFFNLVDLIGHILFHALADLILRLLFGLLLAFFLWLFLDGRFGRFGGLQGVEKLGGLVEAQVRLGDFHQPQAIQRNNEFLRRHTQLLRQRVNPGFRPQGAAIKFFDGLCHGTLLELCSRSSRALALLRVPPPRG